MITTPGSGKMLTINYDWAWLNLCAAEETSAAKAGAGGFQEYDTKQEGKHVRNRNKSAGF